MAGPSLNVVTHFTHYTVGHAHLGLYAFFTMIMFGAMYYILPRVVGWEWPSARLIRWHFWLVAIGIGMMVIVLTLGGILQGLALLDPNITFMASLDYTKPWLFLRSVSGILLTAGHIVFAVSFTLLLLKAGALRTEPTLFGTDQGRKPEPLNA
jgi:cytochrome c oxidase cbb3-type subunit 1